MRALEIAVDQCIQQAEERTDPEPLTFTADLTVTFKGPISEIRSLPKLDFSKPMEPQLETEAEEVEERTIVLNGTPMPIEAPSLTYEDIVFMAEGVTGRILSVTCRVPGRVSFIVTPGDEIRVIDGMVINAMSTNNA